MITTHATVVRIQVMISKLEIEAYQNVNIIEQSSLKAWKIESAR